MRRVMVSLAVAPLLLLWSACAFPTGGSDEVPDVRGTWELTGEQVSPPRTLVGELAVTAQDGDLIVGTVQWESSDGLGGTTVGGGAISGRVIGQHDVDFETVAGVVRRFVGTLSADTISGTWLDLTAGGSSGTFRVVREDP